MKANSPMQSDLLRLLLQCLHCLFRFAELLLTWLQPLLPVLLPLASVVALSEARPGSGSPCDRCSLALVRRASVEPHSVLPSLLRLLAARSSPSCIC